jgi:hypothetical protein
MAAHQLAYGMDHSMMIFKMTVDTSGFRQDIRCSEAIYPNDDAIAPHK